MKPISSICFALLSFCSLNVKAQTQLLEKAIQKLSLIKNISYTSTHVSRELFHDELSYDTLQSFLSNEQKDGKRNELFQFVDSKSNKVFNGSVLLRLNKTNKTYSVDKNSEDDHDLSTSVFGWLKSMQEAVTKQPNKVKVLADTMINKIPCYHVRVMGYDTVINKEHLYTRYEVYLNKATYLPVRTKKNIRGTVSKGGNEIPGIITYMQEKTYNNYKIDHKDFPDLAAFVVPVDYKPEKSETAKPLLAIGVKAPDWNVQNVTDSYLSNEELKGKVVLIDFTSNYCPACILAIPTMNNLAAKYANTDVKIMSMNGYDSKESIIKFAKKHKIDHPIYFNTRKVNGTFNVRAVPTFYLMDKEGKIAATFEGYNKGLEAELIAKIETLRK